MSKKTIALIVAVIFVLSMGAGAWVMVNNDKTKNSAGGNENVSAMDQKKPTKSIREMLTTVNNQKCTFENSKEGLSTKGTLYFGSAKMKGDITSKQNGTDMQVHTLFNDNTLYVWNEGQTQGIKMTLDPNDKTIEQSSGSADVDTEMEYSCNPWLVDQSVFNLPTTVDFDDFSSMIQDLDLGEESNTAACDSCNDLPEEVKEQCLTMLKCN